MPADDLDALLCLLTSPAPFPANHLKALSTLFDANAELGVAAGVPGPGAAGFRRSHLAARDAHRVARYRQRAGVTGYADIAAVALLSCDVEGARWFVAEELGRLGADDPALDDLRSTALCYLDSGRNLGSPPGSCTCTGIPSSTGSPRSNGCSAGHSASARSPSRRRSPWRTSYGVR